MVRAVTEVVLWGRGLPACKQACKHLSGNRLGVGGREGAGSGAAGAGGEKMAREAAFLRDLGRGRGRRQAQARQASHREGRNGGPGVGVGRAGQAGGPGRRGRRARRKKRPPFRGVPGASSEKLQSEESYLPPPTHTHTQPKALGEEDLLCVPSWGVID